MCTSVRRTNVLRNLPSFEKDVSEAREAGLSQDLESEIPLRGVCENNLASLSQKAVSDAGEAELCRASETECTRCVLSLSIRGRTNFGRERKAESA